MRWRDGRVRQQEGARDLFGGEAADHPQRQRGAGLARQARMAGGEDQPQQFVADIVVERCVQIGHGLLLLLHVPRHDVVLAREHLAAAQMIQRPALGGRHQPGAGLFRHAGRGPMLDRRQQGFLRQILRQRHVAQHPRKAGDQPRLLDAPNRNNGAMDVGCCHDWLRTDDGDASPHPPRSWSARLGWHGALQSQSQSTGKMPPRRQCAPSPACGGGLGWGCQTRNRCRVERASPTRRALASASTSPASGRGKKARISPVRSACTCDTRFRSERRRRPGTRSHVAVRQTRELRRFLPSPACDPGEPA